MLLGLCAGMLFAPAAALRPEPVEPIVPEAVPVPSWDEFPLEKVLAFNFVGDGLRDAIDPYSK